MDTARFLEGDNYDEFSTQQGSRSTSINLDNLLNFGLKKRGAACQYQYFFIVEYFADTLELSTVSCPAQMLL